jgi:flagellar biosynthetic protein FlhB
VAEDRSQKTEAATPRRREEARDRGQIAFSADLMNGVGLIISACVFWLAGANMADAILSSLKKYLGGLAKMDLHHYQVTQIVADVSGSMVKSIGVLVGVMALGIIVTGGLQTGFLIVTKPLSPDCPTSRVGCVHAGVNSCRHAANVPW